MNVFGTIPENGGGTTQTTVHYVVDNLPPQIQTLPPALNTSYRTQFFSSPPLAHQQHTLVAVITSVGPTYFLDYLTYSTNQETTPSPSACPTTPPPPTPSVCTTNDERVTILMAVVVPVCAVLIATVVFLGYRMRGKREVPPEITPVGAVQRFILSSPSPTEVVMEPDLGSGRRVGYVMKETSIRANERFLRPLVGEGEGSSGSGGERGPVPRMVQPHVSGSSRSEPQRAVDDAPPAYEGT